MNSAGAEHQEQQDTRLMTKHGCGDGGCRSSTSSRRLGIGFVRGAATTVGVVEGGKTRSSMSLLSLSVRSGSKITGIQYLVTTLVDVGKMLIVL